MVAEEDLSALFSSRIPVEEREHSARLNALRAELEVAESGLAGAVTSFDVERAAALLPRRDVLRLIIAAAAERAEEYRRAREESAVLADRQLSRASGDAARARQSAVTEAASLRRKLEAMAFEREAMQNQRATGGEEFDRLMGAERGRVHARYDELRERFHLSDWEVSDANPATMV